MQGTRDTLSRATCLPKAGHAGQTLQNTLNLSNPPCTAQPRSSSPLAFNYTFLQPLVLSPSITPTLSRSGRQQDTGSRVKCFADSFQRKETASDGNVPSPRQSQGSRQSNPAAGPAALQRPKATPRKINHRERTRAPASPDATSPLQLGAAAAPLIYLHSKVFVRSRLLF